MRCLAASLVLEFVEDGGVVLGADAGAVQEVKAVAVGFILRSLPDPLRRI